MTDSLRKYLAELFGTFTLVFVGSVAILASKTLVSIDYVEIGFAFGLALLAALYAFGEVSGGHFNPIVSIAMVLDGRLSRRDLVPYWIAQFAGAVLASLCVLATFSKADVAGTTTQPRTDTSAWEALFLELLVSAIFVLVILRVTQSGKFGGTALVAIPLTLVAAHLALIPYSGSSLNTARSFGPALIGWEWKDFWVYLVGPPLGAILGWLIYSVAVKSESAATA